MNNHKICFISCVNDEELYEESLKYIKALEVPENYELEFVAITDARSMAEGYNRGLRLTDAKYKIYLHQDVFIINKQIIMDVLNLFEKHPKIGMLGVIGAKQIPETGIWWEATEQYGKVIENSFNSKMRILSVGDVLNDINLVAAVDGLIMITQYDLPWREDLFDGWHFYDVSQCMEFIRTGYYVGVPKQEKPWVIHDCGIANMDSYEKYRQSFLYNYMGIGERS
ncbi:glycosyltransferase family protein [Paenibacillus sp. DYY-L-2]|uniref:glycosyltransferase family protein n=1 Tax=Paenibacillus sp. DYY-L-2 TaxID=3447013 RepID=UPI003F5049A9